MIRLALALSLLASPAIADKRVDVALVLAADVSMSMSAERLQVQRDGYVAALRDPLIVQAVELGLNRRIAVTYFEWGAAGQQWFVAPWTVVETAADMARIADQIQAAPLNKGHATGIGEAMDYAGELFKVAPQSDRKVLDVSGDGVSNTMRSVELARAYLTQDGVTINGLPILPSQDDNLTDYYGDCVAGGDGSFVIVVHEPREIENGLRAKLIMEIAGYSPERGVVPANATECR